MPEKKINSDTFKFEKLTAIASLSLLTRLTKMIGPGLGMIAGIFDINEEKRDGALMGALAAIVERTDADAFQKMIVEVTEYAQIKMNGVYEPVVFDHHFSSDLMQGFKVFIWVLEENFKSFFEGLKESPMASRMSGLRPPS